MFEYTREAFLDFMKDYPITDEDILNATNEAYQEGLISEEEYRVVLKSLKAHLNQVLPKEEVDLLSKEDFNLYYQNMLKLITQSFSFLSYAEQNELSVEELCEYKKRERLYLLATKAKLKGLTVRKLTYPFIYTMLPVYHLFKNISVKVNGKVPRQFPWKRKPIILAVSHIGMYDTEVILQAVKKHFYLLSDDEEFMYRTFDGWYFDRNGVIYVDNDDRVDKRVAFETTLKYLKAKKNVLWCPEGIWNLDINKIILYLAFGIINAAYQADALILPLGIEQFDQEKGAHFIINIGDLIDVKSCFKDSLSEKENKIMVASILRDSMAPLKFNAWGSMRRDEIEKDYYQKFVEKRLAEWPYFNAEKIKKRTFIPSNIILNEDAFKHLSHLDIGSHNAFLARIKKDYDHELEEKDKLLVRP